MQNKILISTGGTGGHVIPATILQEHLSEKNDVIISTDRRGYKYLNEEIHKIEIIDTPKLNNVFLLPFNFLIIIFLTIKSFFLLKKKNIKLLFSTGGYMSIPLILAAKLRKLKIYLLEPNLVLGRSNKFFVNSCEKIFCYSDNIKNFPEIFKDKIKVINPLVRKEFYKNTKTSINIDKFVVLIIGGSQGASIFDRNLKNSVVHISKKFSIKIIQQTSKKNIENLRKFYFENKVECEIFNYDKNLITKILNSDLCITRAGSSTLAELSILNIPFIAIPLASSKDNHQFENANFYKNKECCWIIDQSVFEKNIEQTLEGIFKNKIEYNKKIENLKKLNYQNTWINVNQKLIDTINEN